MKVHPEMLMKTKERERRLPVETELGAGVLSWKFVAYSRTPSPPTPLPQGGEGRVDFTTLAPLGERVDRLRRFHQPGREGGPTLCL